MTKFFLIVATIVWGLWWFAGSFRGPVIKDTVEYGVTEQGRLQKTTTYTDEAQRAYQRTVRTPVTPNDWLGRIRRQQNSWQWWLFGCGPFAVVLLVVVRDFF